MVYLFVKQNMKEIYEYALGIILVIFIAYTLRFEVKRMLEFILKHPTTKSIYFFIINMTLPIAIFFLVIIEFNWLWLGISVLIVTFYQLFVKYTKINILKKTCEIKNEGNFKAYNNSAFGFDYFYTDFAKNIVKNQFSEEENELKTRKINKVFKKYMDYFNSNGEIISKVKCIGKHTEVIKKEKVIERNLKNLINEFNAYNLKLSIVIFGIFCFIKGNDYEVHILFLFAIFLRCFSRGTEITVAFYKDIIDSKKKSSGLEASDRIKLATKSLLEVTLLFATMYMYWSDISDSIIYSIGISTLLDVNLTYEVNPIRTDSPKGYLHAFSNSKKIIATFHTFIAGVLIVLSLARYIGDVKGEK